MCIIIYKAAGETIPLDHLENGWANNPDGGGYAFIADGEVQLRKGLMTFGAWLDSYLKDVEEHGDDSPFVLHFRIGTHGPNDEANTHPHKVNRTTVMAHNGMIRGMTFKKDDKRSDTRVFVDDIIRLLPRGWLKNPAIVELVEDRIGSGNKLVFLTADPTYARPVHILNSHRGTWKGRNWYSNYSFERSGWKGVNSAAKGRSWVGGSQGKATPVKPLGSKPDAGARSTVTKVEDDAVPFTDGDWYQVDGELIPQAELVRRLFQPETEDDTHSTGAECEPCSTRCHLCDTDLTNEVGPWCWDCLWCQPCDKDVQLCSCQSWKQSISWFDWGSAYLTGLLGEDDGQTIYQAWRARYDSRVEEDDTIGTVETKSIHDMSDEEVASLG